MDHQPKDQSYLEINDQSIVDDHKLEQIELKVMDQTQEPPNQSQSDTSIARHFGNNCVFVFRNDEPKYTLGPHWMVFLCAFVFDIGIQIFFLNSIGQLQGWFGFIFQSVLAICQVLSYLLTAITNPGIKSSQQPLTNEQINSGQYCLVCKVQRIAGYYHCYDCDVCVAGYDHHCPWTGKCIGEGNISLFNRFIVLTFFNCAYFIFIVLVKI